MAAVAKTTETKYDIATTFTRFGPSSTGGPVPGDAPQNLSTASSPRQTSVSAGSAIKSSVHRSAVIEETSTKFDLFTHQASKKISAVIGTIMPDSVTIHCLMPNQAADIQLPAMLVPKELLNFGTPVSISLDATGGARRPIIEPRVIAQQSDFPDQPAIDNWIDSL
jgi:hypothetical protein